MENVTVQQNAFVFCRYSVAVMVWAAFVLGVAGASGIAGVGGVAIGLLWAVLGIMALSAALTVGRAPMVWLWTNTLGRVIPSRDVVLDIQGMRFAHILGGTMAAISLALLYARIPGAWWFVLAFALLKTTSALGFCPAYKLWGCAIKGGCCALTAKR